MSQKPKLENSTSAQCETPGYGAVMIFYLVTGAIGSLYIVFLWLLDRGFLQNESLAYFLIYGLPGMIVGLLITYGWLLGVFLIIRYRRSWRVIAPAAALVALGIFSFFGKALLLPASISDVVLVFYIIAASLVGIEWLTS